MSFIFFLQTFFQLPQKYVTFFIFGLSQVLQLFYFALMLFTALLYHHIQIVVHFIFQIRRHEIKRFSATLVLLLNLEAIGSHHHFVFILHNGPSFE